MIHVRGYQLSRAAGILLFVAGIGFALLRIAPLPSVSGVRLGAPWVLEDFRQAVYYPTHAFWHGLNPYASGVYLARYPVPAPFAGYAPATLLVYLPFGLLPLEVASAGYFILSLALTLLLGAVAVYASNVERSPAAILATSGVILLSRPGQWNLLLGQVTLPAVLGVYASMLLARRSPAAAGLGIAFSLLKPTYGIPLIPLLLAQGLWGSVAWGLAIALLLNLPVLAVLVERQGGIAPFLAPLLEVQRAWAANPANDPLKNVWRLDAPALVSRIVGTPIGTEWSLLIGGVVIALAGLALARLGRSTDENSRRIALGITCCAVLLSVYHKGYDLLLLVLPVMNLVRVWKLGFTSRLALQLEAGFLIILAGNYFASESVFAALPPGEFWGRALVYINGVSLLCLFLLYLWQAQRYAAPANEPPLAPEDADRSHFLQPAR